MQHQGARRVGRVMRRPVVLTIVAALVAGVASVLYLLAPVTEHTVRFHWQSTPDESEVVLPLSPNRPATFSADLPCPALVAGEGTGPRVLLTTTYVGLGDQRTRPTKGANWRLAKINLRVRQVKGQIEIKSAGDQLARLDVASLSSCSLLRIDLDGQRSRVRLDDRTVVRKERDLRPVVTGLFADQSATPVTVDIKADTQFDSSPTLIKIIVGVLAAAALILALMGVHRLDGGGRWLPFDRLRERGSWRGERGSWLWGRLGLVDVIVVLIMITWAVIGAGTDDDGFIAQIIRNRDAAGFFGNYVRWDNTPEAPFGWFYELYALAATVSWEPLWLRLLPLLIGMFGWILTRHLLLPRLIRRPTRSVIVATAAAFLLPWMFYGNSLRPEIWFALGIGLTLLLMDMARVSRRLLPLCLAALVAGLTAGTGPTGLVAFAPLIAALPVVIRTLGRRSAGTVWAVLLAALASAGIVLLAMFNDQTLASAYASYRARIGYGPDYHWFDDWRRYLAVLQSTFVRSVTVCVPIVVAAVMAAVLMRLRWIDRVRISLAQQLLASFFLFFPILMFSPTKLYHHFGGLIILTPLIVALAVQVLSQRRIVSPAFSAALVAGLFAAVGVSARQNNAFWQVATIGIWSNQQPLQFGPIPLSTPILVVGIVLALVIIIVGYGTGKANFLSLWVSGLLVTALVLSVAFLLLIFVKPVVARPGRYTIGASSVAAITGQGCLLERSLLVETDPSAGLLSGVATDKAFGGPQLGGLPAWSASRARSLGSAWYSLPAEALRGEKPVVISVRGQSSRNRVWLEFDHGKRMMLTSSTPRLGRDFRFMINKRRSATKVRIVAEASARSKAFRVSAPRVPETVDLRTFVGDEPVALGWQFGFFTPCLRPAVIGAGKVEVPHFAFGEGPSDQLVSSQYRGGPFGGLADVASFEKLPLYPARGDVSSKMNRLELEVVRSVAGSRRVQTHHGDQWRWGWEPTPVIKAEER